MEQKETSLSDRFTYESAASKASRYIIDNASYTTSCCEGETEPLASDCRATFKANDHHRPAPSFSCMAQAREKLKASVSHRESNNEIHDRTEKTDSEEKERPSTTEVDDLKGIERRQDVLNWLSAVSNRDGSAPLREARKEGS
jgi:hypothetical protein